VETRTVGAVHDAEGPISSSRIRAALKSGDCATATRLLTRPFAIRGVVQHGDKLGRTIGFPTANLPLGSYLRPLYGIYAVTGALPGAKPGQKRVVQGAANLGVRPTFDPPKELLEPFFFDFDGDLYGAEIEVAFHHFLRGEAKFDTLEALTAQMELDCNAAKALLGAMEQ
jgi:riboflavin kinase / FMN adenylyltransferase